MRYALRSAIPLNHTKDTGFKIWNNTNLSIKVEVEVLWSSLLKFSFHHFKHFLMQNSKGLLFTAKKL
jgi:hypothetical protein